MNCTISIVYKQLSYIYSISKNRETFCDRPLEGILFWNGNRDYRGHLLVMFAQDVLINKQRLDSLNILCIGSVSDQVNLPNADIIFISDALPLFEYMNQLLMIFESHRAWTDACQNEVLYSRKLQPILDCSRSIFHMELAIIDKDHTVLAQTPEFLSKNRCWTEGLKQLPLQLMNVLYDDEDFIQSLKQTEAFLFPSGVEGKMDLCYNIWYRGSYKGRIIATWPQKEHCQADLALMNTLGGFVTRLYEQREGDIRRQTSYFHLHMMIVNLLNGTPPMTDMGDEILKSYGWERCHQYQVLEFSMMSRQPSLGPSAEYFCHQVEQLFKECCATVFDNKLICVRNYSLEKLQGNSFDRFPYLLRDTLCKAGISNLFDDFYDLPLYLKEAHQALITGRQTNDMMWYYNFRDYTMDYIRQLCLTEYPAIQLCHPAIRQLQRFDERESTQLLETLRIFLKCRMNVSHAADALYIHRTTMNYRLNKIRELTGLTLENFEENAHLMLSFLLLSDQKVSGAATDPPPAGVSD